MKQHDDEIRIGEVQRRYVRQVTEQPQDNRQKKAENAPLQQKTDTFELSEEARIAGRIKDIVSGQNEDIRQDKIDALKADIRNNTYSIDASIIAGKILDELI